jgi:predicted NodU family carbamoyl transferase
VLSEVDLKPWDVEEVALANLMPFPSQDRAATIRAFRGGGRLSGRVSTVVRRSLVGSYVNARRRRDRLARYMSLGFGSEQLRCYEHHACHAATAYYGYGHLDEPVLVVTCDGNGDGLHPYDRTCRPQVVTRTSNPEYWDLLDRFRKATGVGGLLNTSLNLHGFPLVHRPENAVDLMAKSGLNRLAIGPFLVTKASWARQTAEDQSAKVDADPHFGRSHLVSASGG